jgi:RNA polymerase primary sigma factor
MRFGISERTDHVPEKKQEALEMLKDHLRNVEANAVRKLRNPSRRKVSKSLLK